MRIAVTTDFSAQSRQAFGTAAALTKALSAELYVVHQAQLSLLPVGVEKFYESLEKKLSELVTTEAAFANLEATPVLVRGGNVRTFAQMLKEREIDLLVMATQGRTGVTRFLLGSFAERAIRFAPCPALVCRVADHESPEPTAGEFDVNRILVGHDLSSQSQVAVDFAKNWAKEFGAKTRLLHVVDSECGITGFEIEVFDNWNDYHKAVQKRALERLQTLVSEDWKELETEIQVPIGHPVLEILSHAQDFKADLIVIGTHGGSAFEELQLGSVAEKVVREAKCPVLLVRGAWAPAE